MINKINNFVDKNDLINMTVLKYLTYNRINLYSDTAQTTVFCFQTLFKEIDEKSVTVDLTENIDKISQQHYHNSDFINNYFIVHIDYQKTNFHKKHKKTDYCYTEINHKKMTVKID